MVILCLDNRPCGRLKVSARRGAGSSGSSKWSRRRSVSLSSSDARLRPRLAESCLPSSPPCHGLPGPHSPSKVSFSSASSSSSRSSSFPPSRISSPSVKKCSCAGSGRRGHTSAAGFGWPLSSPNLRSPTPQGWFPPRGTGTRRDVAVVEYAGSPK